MVENKVSKSSIMWMFAGMWLLCIASAISMKPYAEQYLLVFVIVSLVAMIGVFLANVIRNVYYSVIISILFVWSISATLSISIERYAGALSYEVVTAIVVSCVIVFIIAAVIGTLISSKLSSWGNVLLIVLIALIVFMIVSIFVPFSSFVMMIVSAIGFLLFVAYTIYDFNMLIHEDFEPYEAPIMALMIFLNLFNMIKFALEFSVHLFDMLGE